jgi:regulator of cell morphogenesis and NO signaling
MPEPKTISASYEQDHDRLDELFKTFQTFKRSDFPKAKEAFQEFKVGLQRHIVWEEDLLFPLWEEKTGMSEGGPTFVMRAEHRQIGAQLEAIHEKVAGGDVETEPEEQALVALLGAHNMKEERVLYPSLDQVTTHAERDIVYRKMEQIPEDRYRLCCGAQQQP